MAQAGINIKLGEKYRLQSDPLNYSLYRINIIDNPESKNHGGESLNLIGHQRSIQAVYNMMIEDGIRGSEVDTVKELAESIESFKAEVSEILWNNLKIVVIQEGKQREGDA